MSRGEPVEIADCRVDFSRVMVEQVTGEIHNS